MEIRYNVEYYFDIDKKWLYTTQANTLDYAIKIAKRRSKEGLKCRARKVIKTVSWRSWNKKD